MHFIIILIQSQYTMRNNERHAIVVGGSNSLGGVKQAEVFIEGEKVWKPLGPKMDYALKSGAMIGVSAHPHEAPETLRNLVNAAMYVFQLEVLVNLEMSNRRLFIIIELSNLQISKLSTQIYTSQSGQRSRHSPSSRLFVADLLA